MLLDAQKLTVFAEKTPVLTDIDLRLVPGKIQVLIGPNGSGKSTLAGAFAGYPGFIIKSGKILLGKKNITEMSPDKRAKSGIFLSMQNPPEIPGIKVRNFLHTCWQEVSGQKENLFLFNERLKKMITKLDMDEDFLTRDVNVGFSGGEKKKFEILQMMILEPRYVLLDEIDSGLDADALKIVAKELKTYMEQDKKRSLLLITHQNKIFDYLVPDIVYIMMNGQIVDSGGKELAQKINIQGYQTYNK